MRSFDIDGVITLGISPRPGDVIITGRSIEESTETLEMLRDYGIPNIVYFNPLPYEQKTREASGHWKARVIAAIGVERHFEDDPIQAEIVRAKNPDVEVIMVTAPEELQHFENRRNLTWEK